MRKIYICPYCSSDQTGIRGYDDAEEIAECYDCGNTFFWDETGKWWGSSEDDEGADDIEEEN